MSLTNYDQEIFKIKEIADKLNCKIGKEQGGSIDEIKDYFMEYNFDTLMELKAIMDNYWEHLNKPYMKEFSSVVAVGAFKNSELHNKCDDISPTIYEF